MAKKFVPVERKDKNGKTMSLYMGTTAEDIIEWLNENGTKEDRRLFKEDYIGYDEEKERETYNWLKAKRNFFKRHCPEHLPVGKEKVKIADLLKDW